MPRREDLSLLVTFVQFLAPLAALLWIRSAMQPHSKLLF